MSSVPTGAKSAAPEKKPPSRKLLVFIAAAFWTVMITASLSFNWLHEHKTAIEFATIEARASFNKDLVYRKWAAMHGGVYAPPTEKTPPNPYLAFIPDRDVVTTSGKRLTLINPAYMTRQVHELGKEQNNMAWGHITSLKPIRPENAADEWEAESLRKFEAGAVEVVSLQVMNGRRFLRLMKPMKAEKSCLKCHGHQGYKEGEIRGGISVSAPFEPYAAVASTRIAAVAAAHLFFWLTGLAGLWMASVLLQRSESGLRTSEERLQSILDNAATVIFLKDTEGRYLLVNRRFEELFHVNNDNIRGKTDFDMFPREAADTFRNADQMVLKARAPVEVEETVPHDDGIHNYISIKFPLFNSDGVPYAVCGIATDITERKLVEKKLQENLEALNASQEIGKLGSYDLDIPGNVWTNTRLLDEIFGIDDSFERTVEGWLTITHPKWREVMGKYFMEEVVGRKQPFDKEYQIVRVNDGVVRWVHGLGRLEMGPEGTPVRMIGTIQDITERKLAEEELRDSRERLAATLNALPDLMFEADVDGRFHDYRAPDDSLLYRPPEVFLGKTIPEVLPESVSVPIMETIKRIAETGNSAKVTYDLALPDGKAYFEATMSPKGDLKKPEGRIILLVRNITELIETTHELELHRNRLEDMVEERTRELKETQGRLIESERLAILGHFAGSLAHEIRSPLAVIAAESYILRRISRDEDIRRRIEAIERQVSACSEIIEGVMNLSRTTSGALEMTDIAPLLRNTCASTLFPKSVTFEYRVPDFAVPVRANKVQINILLKNLIKNSLEAMPDGGIITLEAGIVEKDAAKWLEIVVSDTGVGFTEEEADRVFNTLYTTKLKGTGFGLSISKLIVEKHGGTIKAKPGREGGAVFTIALPLSEGDVK